MGIFNEFLRKKNQSCWIAIWFCSWWWCWCSVPASPFTAKIVIVGGGGGGCTQGGGAGGAGAVGADYPITIGSHTLLELAAEVEVPPDWETMDRMENILSG